MHRARTVGPPPKSERPGPVRQGCAGDLLGKIEVETHSTKSRELEKNIPSDSHPNIVTELFLSFENHQKGFKRIQKV